MIKAQRREEKFEKPSVIVLSVEAMSRSNFIRQMAQTRKFLLDKMEIFEMSAYNKVDDNTCRNMGPVYSGHYYDELEEICGRKNGSQFRSVLHDFSARGYMLTHAEDDEFFMQRCIANNDVIDYSTANVYRQMKSYDDIWTAPFCFGSITHTEFILDYIKRFAIQYRNKPTFILSHISHQSHDDLNGGSYADASYVRFLKNLKLKGIFNNSILIMMGDHGFRFGPFRNSRIGYLEERLPYLSIAVPEWFRRKYPTAIKNLKMNHKRLTTNFDIHATLREILRVQSDSQFEKIGNLNQRGISLFHEIPRERTCDHASILPHWCTCMSHEPVAVNDTTVKIVTDVVIKSLNRDLRSFKRCATLSLKYIVNAKTLSTSVAQLTDKMKEEIIYQVEFVTVLGNAHFEATAHYIKPRKKVEILADVSRLNRYDNQSDCVTIKSLKKFCYCK